MAMSPSNSNPGKLRHPKQAEDLPNTEQNGIWAPGSHTRLARTRARVGPRFRKYV